MTAGRTTDPSAAPEPVGGAVSPAIRSRALLPALLLTAVYASLFMAQINLPPLERYPGWDWFWIDVVSVGKLAAVKHALSQGEIPAINPYVGFGTNLAGDTTMPSSFLSPLNLLVLVASPAAVMAVRTYAFLVLGATGAFLLLSRVTGDRALSLFGALTTISLPYTISMHYYHSTLYEVLSVPMLLYLIHAAIERRGWKPWFLFALLSWFAVVSGDVYVFVLVPATVAVYSLVLGRGYYGLTWLKTAALALALVTLNLLAGAIYSVPLYSNLADISRSAASSGVAFAFQTYGVERFYAWMYSLALPTFYKPHEGSGVVLYAPVAFYVVIAAVVIFRRTLTGAGSRAVWAPLSAVAVAFALFAGSFAFYAVPALAALGKGTLRLHLNAIPYLVTLAAFMCFAMLNRARDMRGRLYLLVILGALAIDTWLFFVPGPAGQHSGLFGIRHTPDDFPSSNIVSAQGLGDLWLVLPWLNLLFPVGAMLIGTWRPLQGRIGRAAVLLASGAAVPFASITLHNDLRASQQSEWQKQTRSAYHWESHEARKACLGALADRTDPNYRTLPAGAIDWGGGGRNWKLLAEPETATQDRQNVLFAYRETMDPYSAILYSTFVRVPLPSNWWPPRSADVPGNLDVVRLMGVKWILSADAPIEHPELRLLGRCDTPLAPIAPERTADGPVYLYQLDRPKGIAFLANRAQFSDRAQAIRTILDKADNPWTRDVVLLESVSPEATATPADVDDAASLPPGEAKIMRRTFNRIDVEVTASAGRYLVVSEVHRLRWRAYRGSQRLTIHRAYGGFMAVQVPPGRSTVTFHYVPTDVYAGVAVTLLAFLLPFGAPRAARILGGRGIALESRVETAVAGAANLPHRSLEAFRVRASRNPRAAAVAACAAAVLLAAVGAIGLACQARAARERAVALKESARLSVNFGALAAVPGLAGVTAGTGHRVQVVQAASLGPGRRPGERALVVDPATRISIQPDVLNLEQGTLVVWARMTNLAKPYSDLVRVDNDNTMYVFRSADGRIAAYYNGSALLDWPNPAMVVTDRWHQYVLTWENLLQRFYIDGRLALIGSARAARRQAATFALGWLGDGTDREQWGGSIAEIEVFDRPLTTQEVQLLHDLGR